MFTIDELRESMNNPPRIRNVCFIGHIDGGKSSLIDSLVAKCGLIPSSRAGTARFTDSRVDEQERALTIKSHPLSLLVPFKSRSLRDGADRESLLEADWETRSIPTLVNLVDTPGHVELSAEVTCALRVTDGAIVVVDCMSGGLSLATETVLRQAIANRVKPVLFVNKLDRFILELRLEMEDCYQSFVRTMETTNVVIATYQDDEMGDVMVRPDQGSVAFGSGLLGWGFTLKTFAEMYSRRFGVPAEKMATLLWGENFFDPATGQFGSENVSSVEPDRNLKRSFCQYCLNPIYEIFDACYGQKREKLEKIVDRFGIELTGREKGLQDERKLLKAIMGKFLPLSAALMNLVVLHLPDPASAQAYRSNILYSGDQSDQFGTGMTACDPQGPVVMCISKMIPTADRGRFYAFGRVFSGTVTAGQRVRVMGPNYRPGHRQDLFVKTVQRVVIMMGRYVESVGDVPCGNLCALVGLDRCVNKFATVASVMEDEAECSSIVNMKFSATPTVHVAVEPRSPADLPRLVEGLRSLAQSDPAALCEVTPAGEHVISGFGELHLELALRDLREDFMNVEIVISAPHVSYRETVTQESTQTCLAKSPNTHNRLWVTAEPLSQDLAQSIDDDRISSTQGPRQRARFLADVHGWDVRDARRIWSFGPESSGPNLLVNLTKGIEYLDEIKESVVAGFQWCTSEGVLASETVRGVRFNFIDTILHADAIHRGPGQIIPTFRRAVFASMLTAHPSLLEPFNLCEIQCPETALGSVYAVLNQRRGVVLNEESNQFMTVVRAYIPASESFGFMSVLRSRTGGTAFAQCVFDHWEPVAGHILPGNDDHNHEQRVWNVVSAIRRRKGLLEEIPRLDRFLDEL